MELATENAKLNIQDPEIEEMAKAGVHMGHAKSKTHPAMQPYIFGVRNGVSIIDLMKTKEKLALALDFLKKVAAKNGLILLVGTRPSAQKIVESIAEETGMPAVTERWIGGTLTNFKVISQRVGRMEELEREKASGEEEKYTKKERLLRARELEKLNKTFNGLRRLKRLPDAVFIVDISYDDTALNEARKKSIPVVALVDTNTNQELVDWPIPSNDDALPAVMYMAKRVKEAIIEGEKMAKAKESSKEEKETEKKTEDK